MYPALCLRFASLLLFAFVAALPVRAGNAPDPTVFLRDFYACYNAQGAAKLGDFYTPDATFVDPSFELNLNGREEIRGLLTRGLAKYESLENEIRHVTPAGDDLIVEGTMVGKLGGKTVRVPFVSIFHFSGGKIAAQRDLFDVLHFFIQLGMIEHPWAPKPKAK
jgi:limonene-1,2-epoxide hydrolase